MRKKIKILIAIILLGMILFFILNMKNLVIKKIYPLKYSECVEKYSEEYNIDKYLVYSIIKAESNFDENAESKRGAQGLMQLMPSTAEEIAEKLEINLNEEKDIFDPDTNIKIGTKCLNILIKKYSNINLALAAYNAGSGNVDKWINEGTLKGDGSDIENIPYLETNNYVRKILRDYEIYKDLYNN